VSGAGVIAGVRAFFNARIWRAPLAELPPHRAIAYRAARVAYACVRGFFQNRLMSRAAALTYFSVLSVVPFLAFAFAILKGLGVYRGFIEGTVRPYLRDTFAGNPALYGALDRTLEFVDQTDVSRLGTLAIVFLLYTSVTLIATVEEALNDVFGANTKRSLLRQLTDYTTLLVTAPILLVVATSLAAAAQSSRFVAFLRDTLALGPVIDLFIGVLPLLVVALALFAIYVILPNVRIRLTSALLGACVAAVAWQAVLVLHVHLQVGVARYNALYSGLAALPIFLVWMNVSWTVVLVGAQLAASHQNEQVVRQTMRMRHADQALKEAVAVALGAVIARDYLSGRPRRSAAGLSEELELPNALVEDVLEVLTRAGLLVKAVAGREITYVPGGDVDRLRAEDLRQALRRDVQGDELRDPLVRRLGPEVEHVLREVVLDRGHVPEMSLRALAAAVRVHGETPRRAARATSGEPSAGPHDGAGADAFDPKQPDGPP
jgi:membrane protein